MNLGPAARDAILVEEVDQRGTPVLQMVTLPEGERGEARVQFMRELLRKRPIPHFAGLFDLGAMPQHVFVVVGYVDPDGKVDITEAAQHRSTSWCQGALDRVFEFLVRGLLEQGK